MIMNDFIWENGNPNEYNFWDNWFKTKGSLWKDDYSRRMNPNTNFSSYLRQFIPDNLHVIKVLDVGSGPIINIGYKWNGKVINITAVDPLAKLYHELYRKHNINSPVKTIYGKAEELSAQFGINKFDLVHAINSLDHAENPLLGIKEMIKCAKTNSWIVLNHNENEGAKEGYCGFHQWNFFVKDGKFIIQGRNGEEWNVNEEIEDVKIIVNDIKKWVQVHIKKCEPVAPADREPVLLNLGVLCPAYR